MSALHWYYTSRAIWQQYWQATSEREEECGDWRREMCNSGVKHFVRHGSSDFVAGKLSLQLLLRSPKLIF